MGPLEHLMHNVISATPAADEELCGEVGDKFALKLDYNSLNVELKGGFSLLTHSNSPALIYGMLMRKYRERRLRAYFLARVAHYKHGDTTRLGSSSKRRRKRHRFTGHALAVRPIFFVLLSKIKRAQRWCPACYGACRVLIYTEDAIMGGACLPCDSREKKNL